MKARIPIKLTKSQQRAMDEEIKSQLLLYDEMHENNVDSIILYSLHKEFGFGKDRLRRFYDCVKVHYQDLVNHYENEDDAEFVCMKILKDIGVDVAQWNKDRKRGN